MGEIAKEFSGTFTTQAPGKIILSGEHAVVYGAPALAMAINRFSAVTVAPFNSDSKSREISFDLRDLDYQKVISWRELDFLYSQITARYKNFLRKNIKINQVLRHRFELALCAVAGFFAEFGDLDTARNFSLQLQSTIPIGSGMGSSAAIIVSIFNALIELSEIKVNASEIFNLAREVESLQHGYSSGLDLSVAQHHGCILFVAGEMVKRKIPQLPFYFVYTGIPEASSGECVEHAAQYFAQGRRDGLVKDFATVTYALDVACQVANVVEAQRCIKENNRLLQQIGVVPKKVQQFIAKLESQGLAAKVCGAGACRGDGAGILLVVGEETGLDDCIAEYNYERLVMKGVDNDSQML